MARLNGAKWMARTIRSSTFSHSAAVIAGDEWNHAYSCQRAAFPAAWVRANNSTRWNVSTMSMATAIWSAPVCRLRRISEWGWGDRGKGRKGEKRETVRSHSFWLSLIERDVFAGFSGTAAAGIAALLAADDDAAAAAFRRRRCWWKGTSPDRLLISSEAEACPSRLIKPCAFTVPVTRTMLPSWLNTERRFLLVFAR